MTNVVDWPGKKTLGQMLNDTAARFGEREAWSFKGERITYSRPA